MYIYALIMNKDTNVSSKEIFCKVYDLTATEVIMGMLMSYDIPDEEAFMIAFRVTNEQSKKMAKKYLKSKQNIVKLANDLRNGKNPAKPNQRNKQQSTSENGISRDFITNQLMEQLDHAKLGKERSDILIKIADLNEVKKEDDQPEDKKVMFYLPLRCENCQYKVRYEEDKMPEME